MRRVEEILEVAAIVADATDRLVTVLERSGACELNDQELLRELARREFELAAVDISCMAFGSPMGGPE